MNQSTMCGICCILGPKEKIEQHDKNLVLESHISHRGPDASNWTSFSVSEEISATLYGFVLHLRGQLTMQPLTDQNGNILLWNGEIFDGLPELQEDDNDTEALLTALSHCHTDEEILSVLSHLQGPWAFIYWQVERKQLWFGRDVLGRRSLLWHLPESLEDFFILSSIKAGSHKYTEIPAVGIFRMKFENLNLKTLPYQLILHPWKEAVWPMTGENLDDVLQSNPNIISGLHPEILEISSPTTNTFLPSICKDMPSSNYEHPPTDKLDVSYLDFLLKSDLGLQTEAEKLIDFLGQSVNTRILNQIPNSLLSSKNLSFNTLSKYNISYKTCSSGDVMEPFSNLHCGTDSVSQLHSIEESNPDHLVVSEESLPLQENNSCDSEHISSETKVIDLHKPTIYLGDANVAILFSGGLDAAVIAALADRYVDPEKSIDLLNVAFASPGSEQQQQQKKKKKDKRNNGLGDDHTTSADKNPFLVPDRLTGYTALEELNPRRKWNFIEINVTKDELQEIRQKRVSHLLYPLCSVLDDSIGCAIWFASRGLGILGNGPNKGKLFYSRAKVILCGMGADELFAGYSRHRSSFSKDGWQGLIQELQTEVNRISARNLGRDDRVISDHGREARFPYLDEKFINFVAEIPAYKKVDLTLLRGIGEKLLLRLCSFKLGFTKTAVQPKRAIQFGSRIAKLENSKEKASDVCTRLKPSS
ncbi:asparagine synthetase domain-containing protein 1 isoform X5 [Octopus sinensis]|uniref:Asparagine synthetase [glutamine-hydrolyzing] n=2 Tax=Octopus sinensis TaxID=2607531 RepID=A0A7E6FAY0_9MOLL|nr:asparagine synthetase domain-containing protein 1 isoform X1 [Octopus sinensis]XP_036364102.1 asparagine synthetase domain-containing protein 1 isoform X2 [Octopus sinensis]XP_036364103.1 asparagine synthetase domain-containing protein 1 isoform X3 [Octopus sinensis]XP_036364104.1 asparagine synthetase domain-containing protein 1 isoform X4 [Octopus sinensis]XP_036364105.1 asparagine synthetase domain-containing protein 1 isoform X5 [Octopus sinensis]